MSATSRCQVRRRIAETYCRHGLSPVGGKRNHSSARLIPCGQSGMINGHIVIWRSGNRLRSGHTMPAQPGGGGSNRQNQLRAKDLAALLTDLVDLWEKYPDRLDYPVRDITRATLADFMQWAEDLFGSNHPIATTIAYLGSVGNYDGSQFPEDKKLTYRDALEYSIMLRSMIRSWLKNEVGVSDWQASGGGSVSGPKPLEGRPYLSTRTGRNSKQLGSCRSFIPD